MSEKRKIKQLAQSVGMAEFMEDQIAINAAFFKALTSPQRQLVLAYLKADGASNSTQAFFASLVEESK